MNIIYMKAIIRNALILLGIVIFVLLFGSTIKSFEGLANQTAPAPAPSQANIQATASAIQQAAPAIASSLYSLHHLHKYDIVYLNQNFPLVHI